ncbi:hypothetical protein F5Y14DRAFT_434204 [Nemania sp. NC0429]|nr:hypothetical protein F5Y14DRAFT_434204 [Nemania sp. NC0429]
MDFNLGVLTTSFTPAFDCNSYVSGLIYTQTVVENGTTNTVKHKYHTLGLNNTSLCYPPYYHVGTGFYYSPAMCPSGWHAACGNFGSGSIPETRATCCPSGYSCIDPPQETETWSTLSCISYAQSTIFVTVPDDDYQVWDRVVQLQPIINAGAINVRWQPTDFVSTTPSTSPPSTPAPASSSSSLTTPSPTTPPPTKPPMTSESPPPPSRQELSTGAKIAIGVGVGGGALLILAIASALYFLLARRRRRKGEGGVGQTSPTSESDTSNNGNNNTDPTKPREAYAEAWAMYQAELQTAENTHEMSTTSNLHEMNTPTPAVYPSHNSPWRSAQTARNWAPHELPAN